MERKVPNITGLVTNAKLITKVKQTERKRWICKKGKFEHKNIYSCDKISN